MHQLKAGKKLKTQVKETTDEVTSSGVSSTGLSEEEVAKGLKEALNQGVEKGVTQLNAKDGYFKDAQIKIPMPEKVEKKLRSLGQDKQVDETIESMNRAAEDAAEAAKDIFVVAIKKHDFNGCYGNFERRR